MNEIEKAIADIKTGYHTDFTSAMSLQALQEKAERDKMQCENCKNIRFNDNFHWCGCSAGLDGNRKVTDFCSYFESKENENG